MVKKKILKNQPNISDKTELDSDQSQGRNDPGAVSAVPVAKVDLPIISYQGMEGYCASDLAIWMDKHGLIDGWRKFTYGNTGATVPMMGQSLLIAYKFDVDKFLEGLPKTD